MGGWSEGRGVWEGEAGGWGRDPRSNRKGAIQEISKVNGNWITRKTRQPAKVG